MITASLIKVLLPWLVSTFVGFLIAPTVIKYLHKFKCWKKKSGNDKGMGDAAGTPIFNELHKERDVKVPRMGGMVIVGAVVITTLLFWLTSFISTGGDPSAKYDYLSRAQTWLPFFGFLAGALMGFVDDYFTINPAEKGIFKRGLALKYRIFWAGGIAFLAALWFYYKLGIGFVHVPFVGDVTLGLLFIPFFILVFVSLFATSNIDGLDGLSGGIMTIIFTAYGFIAFSQNQVDIAAFCFVVVGALLAFLWFNIPPAKFYMTEVGYNALSFSLAIIAFMTNTVILLPIIAFALYATEVTTVMQVLSKKFRKKKIFLVAPIHHHFEALGWPAHTVVMKYWIVSITFAIVGVVLAIAG